MNSEDKDKSKISYLELPETPRRLGIKEDLPEDERAEKMADSLADKSKYNFGKLAFYSFTVLAFFALVASVVFWQRSSDFSQQSQAIQLQEMENQSNWVELAEAAVKNKEPIPDPPNLDMAQVFELGSKQSSNFWRALFSAGFVLIFALGAILTGISLIGRKVEHEMKIGLSK